MGSFGSKESPPFKLNEAHRKYHGELKENVKEGKGTYIDKDGARYEGDWHLNKKHGKGTYYLKNGELYIGEWAEDKKHGFGKYFYQNGERYFGNWDTNFKEGRGIFHYTDGSYYEGNFHNDQKRGAGKLHKADGTVEEQNHEMKENICEITKLNEEFRQINDTIVEETKEEKPPTILSNSEMYKPVTESIDDKIHFSEFKSDMKTLDIGLETLSLIDQIEMMNSLNAVLLKKDLQEWSVIDVSEWLSNIGLHDYVDIFKKNHISGKNLLDITENELKDDLGVLSVGHRKNFLKSQEHLKKIYTKNRVFNQAIRTKLKKFYEKHKNHLRTSHNLPFSITNNNSRFNSIYNTTEVIEEDQNDQASVKEEYNKVPKTSKTKEQIEDTDDISRDVYLKKRNSENLADDELEGSKSLQAEKEKEVSSVLIKKKSRSPGLDISKDHYKNQEEGNKGVSDSESSSDTSSSSDEEAVGPSVLKKKSKEKEKIVSGAETTKGSSPLIQINNAKKSERTKKTMTHSARLDKNFVLKTLKEVGIGINFLLDPKELEIMQKIGEGGYGDVYYGKWLGQDVAIKHFGKSYTKFHRKKLADFIKEVEVISNLRHPNILLYMGVCINCPKFACPNYLMLTEYLEGGSLFDLLHKKHVKLTEERLILIAEDIALGMNYLHSRKVLHRDLKSSNILVDSNWNIKICDFGLSTVNSKLDRKKHKKEGRIGTPHWMAPEIMRSEPYDEFSDIYSYGMIVWEMLMGEVPYNGLSVPQIYGRVGYDNLQVQLPKEGNSMILKILEKSLNRDRAKRPNFGQIVELLQNKNRGKENKRFVINELRKFFNE